MKYLLVSLLTLSSLFAESVDVGGYPVDKANTVWAKEFMDKFPGYFDLAPVEIHERYGSNINSWRALPGFEPAPLTNIPGVGYISWEVRRDYRLDDTQEEIRGCLRLHRRGRYWSRNRQSSAGATARFQRITAAGDNCFSQWYSFNLASG